ncbi:MAG: hypothetical protein OEL89_01635 [Candidatus Peregrinibacteria bacterium]|nr:hypothetical protein [Candidatus Peregrinibacteria bacterium]
MILSFVNQQLIKPLGGLNGANTHAEKRYTQLSTEVESLEIDKLLGSEFYQEVANSPESFDDLLKGCTFTNKRGIDIKHLGLNYVIAYLNYSRWLLESDIFDTFSGFRQKETTDSVPLSKGRLDNENSHNREIAFNAFKLTREYIECNLVMYPNWNCESNQRLHSPKFYTLKKTR